MLIKVLVLCVEGGKTKSGICMMLDILDIQHLHLEKKEKFMLFSDLNGSLLRRQPRAIYTLITLRWLDADHRLSLRP